MLPEEQQQEELQQPAEPSAASSPMATQNSSGGPRPTPKPPKGLKRKNAIPRLLGPDKEEEQL